MGKEGGRWWYHQRFKLRGIFGLDDKRRIRTKIPGNRRRWQWIERALSEKIRKVEDCQTGHWLVQRKFRRVKRRNATRQWRSRRDRWLFKLQGLSNQMLLRVNTMTRPHQVSFIQDQNTTENQWSDCGHSELYRWTKKWILPKDPISRPTLNTEKLNAWRNEFDWVNQGSLLCLADLLSSSGKIMIEFAQRLN